MAYEKPVKDFLRCSSDAFVSRFSEKAERYTARGYDCEQAFAQGSIKQDRCSLELFSRKEFTPKNQCLIKGSSVFMPGLENQSFPDSNSMYAF